MDMNFTLSTTGEEGLTLLKQVKVFRPDVPVILMTAWGSIQLAVQGMQAGAFDFITKPWNNAALLRRIETALELSAAPKETSQEQAEGLNRSHIIGKSQGLMEVLNTVARIARTNASVLITGESGTGKELFAHAIHNESARAGKPFLIVNCGALPQSLIQSELFGYERGAFTGANREGKAGLFEVANEGTIFLDEVGELSLATQTKLLRVLQEREFTRVGGSKPISIDVRVIAATNKPLADMAASGQFREDLFYRLRVLTVEIPPLRERPDDIPVLAMHFLQEIIKKNGLQKNFDPQVLNCFLTYRWPGNVRELRALVQSLATMSEEETITMQDLPQYMQAQSPLPQGGVSFRQPMREAVAELERNMIMAALTETGSTYKAARRLKVSQSTIVRKAQRYKIGLVEIAHK